MTKREYVHNDFLIDSRAATSVCQQSLVDSLGEIPRGPGVELISATGHQFMTTGNTTICLRTRDGINVSAIISVGQVCDRGNIFTFRSTGGTILNEFTGNRIEFERVGGICRLKADASAKMYPGKGGAKMLMDFDQDGADTAEAQLARSGNVPVLPSEAEVETTRTNAFVFPKLVQDAACVPKARKAHNHDASPVSVSKFATDYMFMGEDGTPITILAGL